MNINRYGNFVLCTESACRYSGPRSERRYVWYIILFKYMGYRIDIDIIQLLGTGFIVLETIKECFKI